MRCSNAGSMRGKMNNETAVMIGIRNLIDDNTIMKAVLIAIAAFNDDMGNGRLVREGSYKGFDEPFSVEIARDAIAACEKENK